MLFTEATYTQTIGVLVRIVCEVCGKEFSVHGNLSSSGSATSRREADAQKEAKEMAAKSFWGQFRRQPLLFWKPCVRCGCIQSWAQGFYLKNRVRAIEKYISLWCIGIFILAGGLLGFLFFLDLAEVWGIAPVWNALSWISLYLGMVALASWLPLIIIFSIISRRRFKRRLEYWLNHPNYSGPRKPSIEFVPPREREFRLCGREVIEFGSPGPIGLALEDFHEKLGDITENDPVVYEVSKKELRPAYDKSTATVFDALLDALCCIMCADGKMSPEEQNAIPVILGKVVCPWTREEIDNKIVDFLRRRKNRELDTVVQETCERLRKFKKRGKEKVLLTCIDYLAKADGVVDEKEIEIREKFKAALGDDLTPRTGPDGMLGPAIK